MPGVSCISVKHVVPTPWRSNPAHWGHNESKHCTRVSTVFRHHTSTTTSLMLTGLMALLPHHTLSLWAVLGLRTGPGDIITTIHTGLQQDLCTDLPSAHHHSRVRLLPCPNNAELHVDKLTHGGTPT